MTLVASIALALGAVSCGDDASPRGAPSVDAEQVDARVDLDSGGPSDADLDLPVRDSGERDVDRLDAADGGADMASDLAQDGGGGPRGTITGRLRTDHFGWRPSDRKVAVVLGYEGAEVELHNAVDGTLEETFAVGPLISDEDSGDDAVEVDFSGFTQTGDFYLALGGLDERSYTFTIDPDVYEVVGTVAMRSFYFQRCNHDRVLPYAGDALPGFAGNGGQWVDGPCHMDDLASEAGPGSDDHGVLDVHGGWHDAGDYQKTLWSRGVDAMLWAYEINPGVWTDGQLNIPESGDGVPDLLNELMWELDFYVRMQRPDGHFMTSVKGRDATVTSPPSASDEERVYFDVTSPSGSGWSGGGVTPFEATAHAVLTLAHASVVLGSTDRPTIAAEYRSAALAGWAWLDGADAADSQQRRLRLAAAAAVLRLEDPPSGAAARVSAFPWASWDDLLPWDVTPAEAVVAAGAWHVLANPGIDEGLAATVRAAVGEAIVDRAFAERGLYGGLYGGPDNAWDWEWGSNRAQGQYGANLMMAHHFGALGSHGADEVHHQAERFFHYMLGLNPLNMVYLTNMAAYGGEHSSFQIYHGWFSTTGGDGDHGNVDYNGLPAGVDEPLYPYYADDSQTSTYGPAPGLVPGGPNASYSGLYEIPHRAYPAYAYRDWSVGCDWNGSVCASASWEITEPMAAYQGPFVLLTSFMMSDQ